MPTSEFKKFKYSTSHYSKNNLIICAKTMPLTAGEMMTGICLGFVQKLERPGTEARHMPLLLLRLFVWWFIFNSYYDQVEKINTNKKSIVLSCFITLYDYTLLLWFCVHYCILYYTMLVLPLLLSYYFLGRYILSTHVFWYIPFREHKYVLVGGGLSYANIFIYITFFLSPPPPPLLPQG